MNSHFLRLKTNDFVKGLVVAVVVVVLGALQQAFETNGLNVALFDWSAIFNVAWQAGVAYLTKNLLTDQEGKVLGKIG